MNMELVEDVTEGTAHGGRRLISWRVSDWIMTKFHFVTLKDNRMLVYNPITGAWEDEAEEVIKNLLETNLKEFITRNSVNEIIEHIRRSDYSDGLKGMDKDFINLKNGVYDIKKDELIPHGEVFGFVYCLPFNYNKNATCPKFMKFLKEVSNGDIELVVNIMEGFAYCLVPDYPIQKAFMLVGSGSNGKSTFLRVLMEFLGGKKNVSNVTLQSISNNRFSVANLQFKLANISYDLPDKAIYDSGMFKSLTGGDTISAEHKGVQRVQQFSNSAKMWFSTNKIPDVNDDSSAYYRRWNVCEFKVKFGEGNDIFSELVTDEELSGIFNLIMKFFYPVIIKNKKFTCSKDAETTRTMYLRMGNTVKAFADECMSFDPNGEIAKSDVYNLYVKFCNRHRMMFITEAGFWRALKSLVNYTERQKERGGNRWIFGQRVNISDGSASDASTASTSTTISLYYNIFIELYEYRVKGIEADARDAVDVNTKNMENTENMEISLEGDINDLPTE